MSADPLVQDLGQLRYYITEIEIQPSITDLNCKIRAKIFIDEKLVCNLPWLDHTSPSRWSRLLLCEVSFLSKIVFRLCRSIKDKQRPFNFPAYRIDDMDEETGEVTLEHPDIVWMARIKSLTPCMAEQKFQNELVELNQIEGIYDSLEPDQTLKNLFKLPLKLASLVANALPQCGGKLSFLIFMKTWELLDQQLELDDIIRDILRGLPRIRDIIEVLSQASSLTLAHATDRLKEPIINILVLLKDASVYIFNRLIAKDLEGHTNDNGADENDTYDIESYLARLAEQQDAFHASWLPSHTSPVNQHHFIQDESTALSLEDAQTLTSESARKLTEIYDMPNLLRPLDPSGYDPDRACMDGTREAVLNRILSWTQIQDNSERFMWISGQAGMGKTSIATSLCGRLDKIGALAGSFFCRRDDPNSSDPLRLINNLVHEIAIQCPAYAYELSYSIRANRKLCTSHLSLRYEGLIKAPLEKLKYLSISKMFVVVIDALDECGEPSSRQKIFGKLYDMTQLVPWLKVVFTSRPGGDIQRYFQKHCSSEPIVHLHTYHAAGDIHAYMTEQLGELAQDEHWPDKCIDQLCAAAQGVFLWAVKVTEYIQASTLPSSLCMRKVLEDRESPVTNHFDALYTSVLTSSTKYYEDEVQEAYSRCIGAIFATSERGHLTIPGLQHLLLVAGRIDARTLERILADLGPLLVMNDGQYARFYHSSFKDYITDRSRAGSFFVDIKQYEAEPADCCFKVMQQDLRFNICKLESSHLLNSQVPDFKLRIHSHIQPALKYACIHWIDHFITSPNQALVESLRLFLEGPQLMYWIEVLSLLGRLNVAIEGFPRLVSLELDHFDGWGVVVSWAADIHRFVLSFQDAITASTPHLYVSALPFAPAESLTAQRMRPYFPNTITINQGANSTWHPCIKTIIHPHAIESLSVSPDGQRMIAGYLDGSLSVWDQKTGGFISESIIGHTNSVTCIVFSPDGGLLASSSYDTTIRIWDAKPSLGLKASYLLTGHYGSVHSIAFSPGAGIIVSGSSDRTIRLWDIKARCSIGEPYIGHSGRVSSVAFSPDGSKVVSASWDKTIRVWSVNTCGQKLANDPLLITGHSGPVTCITFSPDGSNIASGSIDKTIRLWDAQTGDKLEPVTPPPKHPDSITSIAFSPNGKLIASSSIDGMVQLRDATTFAMFSRSFGHPTAVHTIAFSPDSSCVVTGSSDMTTRVWNFSTERPKKALFVAPGPLLGHSDVVYSVAFSANGDRIISGSGDPDVRIWDTRTGAPIGKPLLGHSKDVYCVAISPDAKQIASGSNDHTMKLWDTVSYTAIHSYQHSHAIRCISFSPDGSIIAFGSEDGNVYLWEPIRWQILGNALQGHSCYVVSVAFSPDGTCLASASGDHKVILWDAKTRNRLGNPLTGHTNWVRSVSFSPCGTKLVSGSDDHTVRLWEIKSGNTIMTLTGHTQLVITVAFSPDGSCIASGSFDETVRLWDAKTGQSIREPFTQHASYVRSVAFSPDGNYLISGSDDRSIRVWELGASNPIPEPKNDLSDTSYLPSAPPQLSSRPDRLGWVTHNQNSLAFWLPAQYQHPDLLLNADTAVRPQTTLDYSKFAHGTTWTAVACDAIRGSSGSR